MNTTMISKLKTQCILFLIPGLVVVMILIFGTSGHASGADLDGRHLKICAGQWPPAYYIEPESEPEKISGVVYLFLEALSMKLNFSFSSDFLPWNRCLKHIISDKKYALVPVVTWNEERAKKIHYTRPFALWKGLYFYRKDQYPSGPNITKASDLSRFNICGRVGYNYDMYGIPTNQVERLSKDINNMVQRLLLGRCDIFLARNVNVSGQVLLGAPSHFKNDKIAYKEVPGMGRNGYYIMVNKNDKDADILLSSINKEIDEAWKSGRMELYMKKTFGSATITYSRPDFK